MKQKKENPGIAMKIYRLERWFYEHKINIVAKIFYRLNFILFNCSIPPSTKIGEGVTMPHSTGIVIHQWSEIGDNTTIILMMFFETFVQVKWVYIFEMICLLSIVLSDSKLIKHTLNIIKLRRCEKK